jgi:hypothetical protein
MRLLQIVEVTPHVRPARRVLDANICIELIESRVGIGLQRPAKLFQMLRRVLAFAIRRVGEPHGGRGGVARRTIIADIGPQASRLGLALARRQHRHRRVVGVQFAGGRHVATHRFHQRFQQPTACAYPVGHRRALQFHTLTRVDLRLPIKRLMITVLRDQHMRQQSRPRQAALDRATWRFRLHDAVALRAVQLRAHVPPPP